MGQRWRHRKERALKSSGKESPPSFSRLSVVKIPTSFSLSRRETLSWQRDEKLLLDNDICPLGPGGGAKQELLGFLIEVGMVCVCDV